MEDKIEGLGNGQVTIALLPAGFLKPLYPDILDIKHTISPTPPSDYPLMSYLSGRGMKLLESKLVPKKPNEMAPKRTPISAAPVMSQAAIRKLVADSVAASLEAQAGTMATTDNTNRNIRQSGTPVARKCGYKEFMSCQPFNFKEVKKKEDEFYNLIVKGNDLKTYVRRFQELAVLCPTMVPNSEKPMEVFIGGLTKSIEGNVTTSKPQTLE
ncbi:hypothetical protein Tco_1258224 [Tanacetum coccineum]